MSEDMSAAQLDQRIAEISQEINNLSCHLVGVVQEENNTRAKLRDLRWQLQELQEAKKNES